MMAVLRKELRAMLRERRAWLVPVIYTAILSAIVAMIVVPLDRSSSNQAELGQLLASVVAVSQTLALLIFAPLVGAAGLASERERGTLALLLVSPVSRTAIGLGKITAALAYCGLLLSASLPVAAVSFLLGGPDIVTLAGLYLTDGILAGLLVCLGFFVATMFRRTWAASLVAMGTAMALCALTFGLWLATQGNDPGPTRPNAALWFNPGFGLALFFAGDELGGRPVWLAHFSALIVVATMALGAALVRLRRMTG